MRSNRHIQIEMMMSISLSMTEMMSIIFIYDRDMTPNLEDHFMNDFGVVRLMTQDTEHFYAVQSFLKMMNYAKYGTLSKLQ